MPTRNISLTDEQDAFVEKVVKAGEYQNASEAVRATRSGCCSNGAVKMR
jgi:Arc/MetJ-type ribon-helix-helix transcriptional regulator